MKIAVESAYPVRASDSLDSVMTLGGMTPDYPAIWDFAIVLPVVLVCTFLLVGVIEACHHLFRPIPAATEERQLVNLQDQEGQVVVLAPEAAYSLSEA